MSRKFYERSLNKGHKSKKDGFIALQLDTNLVWMSLQHKDQSIFDQEFVFKLGNVFYTVQTLGNSGYFLE